MFGLSLDIILFILLVITLLSFALFILVKFLFWFIRKSWIEKIVVLLWIFLGLSLVFFIGNLSLSQWTLITIIFAVLVSIFSKETAQSWFGIDIGRSVFSKNTLTNVVNWIKISPFILYLSIFFTIPEGKPFLINALFEMDINQVIYVSQANQDALTITLNDSRRIELQAGDRLEVGSSDLLIILENGEKLRSPIDKASFEIENQKWQYSLHSKIGEGDDGAYSFTLDSKSTYYRLPVTLIRVLYIEIFAGCIYLFHSFAPLLTRKWFYSWIGQGSDFQDLQGDWYQIENYVWFQEEFVYTKPSFTITGTSLIISDKKIITNLEKKEQAITFEIEGEKYTMSLTDGILTDENRTFIHKSSDRYKSLNTIQKVGRKRKQKRTYLKPVLKSAPHFVRTEHIFQIIGNQLVPTRTGKSLFALIDDSKKQIFLPDNSSLPYEKDSTKFVIGNQEFDIFEA
ncbi:TPA: hypothetical protein ACGORS_002225 [Streptococcus suis]